MNYIAALATFGLVFVAAYWLATKLLERRVSVMERIGGMGMNPDTDSDGMPWGKIPSGTYVVGPTSATITFVDES